MIEKGRTDKGKQNVENEWVDMETSFAPDQLNETVTTRKRVFSSDSVNSNEDITAEAVVGGDGIDLSGKIDILRELEDIAKSIIRQTSFFSNTLDHLDKIKYISSQTLATAKSKGYLEQNGVMRTNCVDCLDRTNGGQFAAAMKFLAIGLESLGFSGENTVVGNKMLLTLMEMYGEMGNKIAQQYGGSEAHNKVVAG